MRTRSMVSVLGLFTALLLSGCSSSGLSGTYEARDADGGMTLEFKSGGKVQVTMQEGGAVLDTGEGDYTVDDERVVIQMQGGFPLTLTRTGNALEGNIMGQVLRFERK